MYLRQPSLGNASTLSWVADSTDIVALFDGGKKLGSRERHPSEVSNVRRRVAAEVLVGSQRYSDTLVASIKGVKTAQKNAIRMRIHMTLIITDEVQLMWEWAK